MAYPAKPTALHLAEGTYRPGRHSGRGLDAAPAKLTCPGHLSSSEKKNWRQLHKAIVGSGIPLCKADAPALEAAAIALTRIRDAAATLEAEGRYVGEGEKRKRHPAAIELSEASRELRSWSGQLGLSPSARASMQAPGPGKPGPASPGPDPFLMAQQALKRDA